MAFQINGVSVVNNNSKGIFSSANIGSYTPANRPTGASVGDIIFNSTAGSVEVWNGSAWITIQTLSYVDASWAPLPAGTEFTSGNYKTVVFTSSATFTVNAVGSGPSTAIDYYVIAGGGSADTGCSGGGGAGGFRTGTLNASTGNYTITVGGGAAGAVAPVGYAPNNGSNSTFGPITSSGGGKGGRYGSGVPGGSGGGGSFYPTLQIPYAGGTGNSPPTTPSQGNSGGTGFGSPQALGHTGAGGGGGLAAAGSPAPSYSTPNDGTMYNGGAGGGGGGIPTTVIPSSYGTPGPSGSFRYFSGGGGGGANRPGGVNGPLATGGAGGYGGGGTGSSGTGPGSAGTVNTGGGSGGGAQFYTGTEYPTGGGGSGIVVIRYKYI